MEIPHQAYMAIETIQETAQAMSAPHVLMKPKFGRDGNQYYFLLGVCIRTGCVGFGDTPALAAQDFDKSWYHDDVSKQYQPNSN